MNDVVGMILNKNVRYEGNLIHYYKLVMKAPNAYAPYHNVNWASSQEHDSFYIKMGNEISDDEFGIFSTHLESHTGNFPDCGWRDGIYFIDGKIHGDYKIESNYDLYHYKYIANLLSDDEDKTIEIERFTFSKIIS